MQMRLWMVVGLLGCGTDRRAVDASACLGPALALQNPRAHVLGETFYLPAPMASHDCGTDLAFIVTSAPSGSENRLYMSGAPQPRFTPDLPGDYTFAIPGLAGSEISLQSRRASSGLRMRPGTLSIAEFPSLEGRFV